MTLEEIEERFRSYTLGPDGTERVAEARSHCLDLALRLNLLLPDGREKALVMTHLEEVSFWANKGISRLCALGVAPDTETEKTG